MNDVTRIKKTKQIVYPISAKDNQYTWVLFPLGFLTKKGNMADVRIVRNDNLIRDKEVL